MIDELIARMAALLELLEAEGDKRRYFHATYLRTTIAVAVEIRRGGFADAEWVERWDVVFADLYLDAASDGWDGLSWAGRRLERVAFGSLDVDASARGFPLVPSRLRLCDLPAL